MKSLPEHLDGSSLHDARDDGQHSLELERSLSRRSRILSQALSPRWLLGKFPEPPRPAPISAALAQRFLTDQVSGVILAGMVILAVLVYQVAVHSEYLYWLLIGWLIAALQILLRYAFRLFSASQGEAPPPTDRFGLMVRLGFFGFIALTLGLQLAKAMLQPTVSAVVIFLLTLVAGYRVIKGVRLVQRFSRLAGSGNPG